MLVNMNDVLLPAKKNYYAVGLFNSVNLELARGIIEAAEDGRVFSHDAPKGTLVNAVGAGDSMVAGFVAGWQKTQDPEYAFRMGLCAGSASAFSEYFATEEEVNAVYAATFG